MQEQAKQFDPNHAEDPEEEWDDALGYLDACGPGFNLIARTSSEFAEVRGLNRTQSLLSQDSAGSKSLNSLLMDDYSLREVCTPRSTYLHPLFALTCCILCNNLLFWLGSMQQQQTGF